MKFLIEEMKFFSGINISLIFCAFSFIFSCTLFQKPENNSPYRPIWEYNFNVGYFSSINPVLHDDKVIFSSLDDKKEDFSANSTLEAFDKKSGELKWRWDDNVPSSFDKFDYKDRWHITNNILYISTGWEYAIDIKNGATKFNNNSEFLGGKSIVGFDNKIFTRFTFNDLSQEAVYFSESDLNWRKLISFNNDDSIRYYIDHLIFDDQNLIIPLLRGRKNFQPGEIILIRYNIAENRILNQDTVAINKDRNRFIDAQPIINKNFLFLSLNGTVACINKSTFELIWQRETIGNSSRSGIMYADNKLYVNTEFQLYALDAETGNIIWEIESSAGSRMQFHKGVIYYTDGISLRGIDSLSGEVLMETDAPSRAQDEGAFFQPVLTIDHENDRIYTASYTHAYCYPTLR